MMQTPEVLRMLQDENLGNVIPDSIGSFRNIKQNGKESERKAYERKFKLQNATASPSDRASTQVNDRTDSTLTSEHRLELENELRRCHEVLQWIAAEEEEQVLELRDLLFQRDRVESELRASRRSHMFYLSVNNNCDSLEL